MWRQNMKASMLVAGVKKRSTKQVAFLLALATVGFAGSVAEAASVPYGADWSYGTYSSLSSHTFAGFTGSGPNSVYPSLQEWSNGSSDPNVIYNPTSTDVVTDPLYGDIDFAAGTVNLGPFLGPTVVEYSVAAPGYYDIASIFQTVQVANAAPDAYIYVDGTLLAGSDKSLAGTLTNEYFGPLVSDNFSNIYVDKSVDFVVFGGDTDNKTTQLSAGVTAVSQSVIGVNPVPLPASAGVGFSTLGVFGMLATLRKRLIRRVTIA